VFVDGCFWHGCPQHFVASKTSVEYWSSKLQHNIQRDALVSEALNSAGWHVLRIWAHVPIEEAVRIVQDALDSARAAQLAGD
jgi:DNA mismatch endonuclease (patch repair protein)